MKKLITAAALGLALVAGSASADKLALQDEQLDNVNAGLALAYSASNGGALGWFFSQTVTNTATQAISGFLFNQSLSAAYSSSEAF